MNIVTVALMGMVTSLIIITLKETKPEFSVLISIAFGIAVIFFLSEPIKDVISVFGSVSERVGIKDEIFLTALKVIGISFIAEFASSICSDAGQNSIAQKVETAGKIMILTLALPLITGVLDTIFTVLD